MIKFDRKIWWGTLKKGKNAAKETIESTKGIIFCYKERKKFTRKANLSEKCFLLEGPSTIN